MEYTFAMIKPDAFDKADEIIKVRSGGACVGWVLEFLLFTPCFVCSHLFCGWWVGRI